jgi:c-di-GMP-binding flagellar brake protein YcgR
MLTDASPSAERREFFRINDTVLIEFQPITATEAEQLSYALKDPLHSGNNQEKSQLRTIQMAFNHLTDSISQHNRDIARALRLLDQKINLINHAVQRSQNKAEENQSIDVNLSGGGIAFMAPSQINEKSAVEVKIELQPSGTYIHTLANVISCTKEDDSLAAPYFLRLAFTDMSEIDRSLLIKHILTRQAESIRQSADNQFGLA